MARSSYEKLPKPLEYRLRELVQSLLVIHDSLEMVQLGRSHQVLPIAGQLRALLTDRATKPLLYAVADSLGVDLVVWTEGGLGGKRGPGQESSLLFGMQGMYLTASKEMAGQVAVPLADALDAVVLHADATNFTARDLIEFLANKAGGAHYEEHLPRTMAAVLRTVHLGDLPAQLAAVVQLGQATFELGRRLLRELTEVDVDLLAVIRRPRAEGPAYLFDARGRQGGMRYFGQVSPNWSLKFGMSGVGGSFAATAQNIHDWSEPHHLRFVHRLGPDLSSVLRIVVDGEERLAISPGRPILAFSDRSAYEVRFNGGHDEPKAACEWGLGSFEMRSPLTGYTEAESLLVYRDSLREVTDYRCMGPEDALTKPFGSDDISGAGDLLAWREWLLGDEGA